MNEERSVTKQKETKRQHTVPAVFLKAFASDGNLTRDGKIHMYFREDGGRKEPIIDNVSIQNHIYTLRDHPKETRQSLEKTFGDIEKDADVPLGKLRYGQSIDDQDRGALSGLFALQYLRTQEMLRNVHAQDAELSKPENSIAYIQKYRDRFDAYQGPEAVDDVIAEIRRTGQGLDRSRSRMLLYAFKPLPDLAESIDSLNWRLERAAKGTAFITSDNPVFVRRRGRPWDVAPVGFEREDLDVEMYVAISPDRFLMGSRKAPRQRNRRVSQARVEHLNRLTIMMADRFVFASKACKQIERLLTQERDFRVQWPDLVSELLSG